MCQSKLNRGSTLSDHVLAWENIDAPDYVIQWIKNGVSIPIKDEVKPFELQNHKLSSAQSVFIDQEITRLLLNDYIEQCPYKPKCISPIGCVPKKNNKFRLITDLRQLNSLCSVPKFRNEDIRDAVKFVKPGDNFVSTDIKDGFFHVPVNIDYRDYLGFRWNNQFYRWKVLPFGLSCSPYYFNKIVRPIVSYLRSLGVRVSVFVDDFILAADASSITDCSDQLIHCLCDLGFKINIEKSQLTPTRKINYLGYTISSLNGKVVVKAQGARVTKLKQSIRRALKLGQVTARALARICGQCVSVAWAVTPGKLFLRHAYRLLSTRSSWADILTLPNEVIEEFNWWIDSVSSWNEREICTETVQAQVVTDASHLGWGAVCNGQIASGDWNKRISFQSSNEREMLAILMALMAFGPLLKGKRVQILTDNISAMAYIRHMGGPSPNLAALAKAIWGEALENGIWLESAHIAGNQNVEADFWSRTPDKHNWQLHPRLFHYIDKLWGPHTVDRFANCQNAQVPRFNSRYWEPLSEGVDALAQVNWGKENNFVNPPFCLLSRVLDVVQAQGAIATVIAPAWKAKEWYQKLLKMSITPPLRIPNNRKTCRAMGIVAEPCRNPKWNLFAWRIYGGTH